MSSSDSKAVGHFRGHTCRDLYKAIFDAEAPEQVVRQLPVQSLYMVVKSTGLQSSSDIILMASLEQCRLLTDFDLWVGDTLNEEALWEWLALTDETESLEMLQKFVKIVDLKLLALLIERYVEVKVFDEANDQPPGKGFHTPDKGFTWIGINTEDANKHFLLARLLALIFESSAELFYQLISIMTVATTSMLEEESYQERQKRLAAEGVPEPEVAAAIHAPYSLAEAKADVESKKERGHVDDIRSIEPLIYEARATKLFAELVRDVADRDELEMEFTYIMNGAVVRWGIDFSNQESVLDLAERIKGAINIGLERLTTGTSYTLKDVYAALGLGKLYRVGITELMALRTKARKIPVEGVGTLKDSDPGAFGALACAREAFPVMPVYLNDDGSVEQEGGVLAAGQRPFTTAKGVETVGALLDTARTCAEKKQG
jgi:hypothetical protein